MTDPICAFVSVIFGSAEFVAFCADVQLLDGEGFWNWVALYNGPSALLAGS